MFSSSTCEKQITVPCNTMLYCSESCRKKDGDKQFVLPLDPLLTPFSQSSNFSCVFYSREIVPPRSPTQPRSNRASCGFPELSSNDDAASGDKKTSQNSDASRY
ncbi:hypothetical protein PMIN03_012725 [Paraphaeosphaeria minitans]